MSAMEVATWYQPYPGAVAVHEACIAYKLPILRSMDHGLFIHGSHMIMMHSGTRLLGHRSIGAWVSGGQESAFAHQSFHHHNNFRRGGWSG